MIGKRKARKTRYMRGKDIRHAIQAGNYVFGTAVLSTSPMWVAVVAGLDLDFVFIDTEHMPIDRAQLSWMCQAYKLAGLAPVVRIPSPCQYEASKALDAGAEGIIAPYVETTAEVSMLAGAVKYRPLKGKKLENVLSGRERLTAETEDYLQKANEHHLLFINLESVPAMECMTDLMSVPGLDGVLVGPQDLSCSLGIPEQYDSPVFIDAVDSIVSEARRLKIGAGVHMFYPKGFQQEQIWAKRGANIILHSSDLGAFKHEIRNQIQALRGHLAGF